MLERFLAIRRRSASTFSAQEKAFKNLVYTPNAHTVVIDLGDGKSFTAILKDIQVHPVTDDILHIDFFQIFGDKEITIEVPVKIMVTQKELWLVEIYV
jgi:large subunit ribosomal protein L25